MAEIILESIIPWTLNGEKQAAFLCTPEYVEELARGFVLTQGMVKSNAQIVSAVGDKTYAQVETTKDAPLLHLDIAERLAHLTPVKSDFCIALSQIKAMCGRLLSDEQYYGTHRLMLAYQGQELFREDIGRHNAADKVIAAALQKGWDLSNAVLGATGRISLEMLAKAAMVGIPVFFSRKYPSDLGIEWANKLGITLVARAFSDAPQVYGNLARVSQA